MRNKLHAFVALAAVVAAALGFVPPETLAALVIGATTHSFDVDEAMKVIFEDSITESYVKDTEALDLFEQDMNVKVDETTGGRYIETAQLFELPVGVGNRAEGEYIPVPGGPTIANSRIDLKKIQATLELSGEMFDTVRTNEGAFVNYAERALPYMAEVVEDIIDRQVIGYGAGAIARVNDATPQATGLALDDAYGIAGFTKVFPLLSIGQSIVFDPAIDGQSLRDGGTPAVIEDIDPSNNQVDLDALPTGVADNDYIFLGDTAGVSTQTAAGVNREFMGLFGMVDDGGILQTFQNIDRTLFRKWQSVVTDAGAVALTEDVLMEADDEAYERVKAEPTVLLTSRKQSRSYWADLKGDRSINDPRGNFEGGLNRKGLKIHLGDRALTFRVSRKLPDSVLFGIDPSTMKRFHNVGFKWDDRTGAIWHRVTDGTGRKDAFYATGYLRMELACKNPMLNWRLDNLSVA